MVTSNWNETQFRRGVVPPPGSVGPLNRIKVARRRQGMTLKTAARRLGLDTHALQAQEEETADLRLSDLYRWQAALDIPVAELLVETNDPLMRPVQDRARLVRVMKTAAQILEAAPSPSLHRMAENLVGQLSELMPELKTVGPWHSVGQRRTQDELGRIAERTIPDHFLGNDWDD